MNDRFCCIATTTGTVSTGLIAAGAICESTAPVLGGMLLSYAFICINGFFCKNDLNQPSDRTSLTSGVELSVVPARLVANSMAQTGILSRPDNKKSDVKESGIDTSDTPYQLLEKPSANSPTITRD